MESLEDILKRIVTEASLRYGDQGQPEIRTLEAESLSCSRCGGTGWVRRKVRLDHSDFGKLFPCVCLVERNEAQVRSRLTRRSNLGYLSDITFGFLRDRAVVETGRRRLWELALQAAEDYSSLPKGWLVLSGPGGSGKTSLAAAVANARLQREQPVFFVSVPDLLDHLRNSYAPDSPVTYDQLLEQVRNDPLLVLDGLGAHNTTPWAQEKLTQILAHRFNGKFPTVITLQCPVEDLEPSLRTRLQSQPFSRIYELGKHATSDVPLLEVIGGLGEAMLDHMTFEQFDVTGRAGTDVRGRHSLMAGRDAARHQSRNQGWLLLSGAPGCGKTHLSVAILNEQRDLGQPGIFAFVPALLDHLRSSFEAGSQISYDREMDRIKKTPLLVLDDLGAEAATPWAEEKLFQIIDYRYNTWLPTVVNAISTIEVLDQTKPRIASRFKDPRVNLVTIEAPDYRDQGGGSPSSRQSRSPSARPRPRAGR